MFNIVAKAARLTEVQKAAAPFRAEGLHRALQIIDMYYGQKMKQADQAEQIDTELDSPEEDVERQARIEARKRRHGDMPENGAGDPIIPDPAEPTPAPPAEPDESENTDPTPPTEPRENPVPAPPALKVCTHCKAVIELPTGSKWCSACVSYKNKNKRLPPKEVLDQRHPAA